MGPLWELMGSYEVLTGPTGAYGVLWGLMGSLWGLYGVLCGS